MTAARVPETDRVAQRAYSIWEEEGRPHGRDRAHWDRAQREMTDDGPMVDAPIDLARAKGGSRPCREAAPRRHGGFLTTRVPSGTGRAHVALQRRH